MSAEAKVIYSGLVVLIAAWFWLWSVVDAALGDETRFATGPKRLWVLVCALFPVLGGVVYLTVGRHIALRVSGAEDGER